MHGLTRVDFIQGLKGTPRLSTLTVTDTLTRAIPLSNVSQEDDAEHSDCTQMVLTLHLYHDIPVIL
jgi:hypothetical protein